MAVSSQSSRIFKAEDPVMETDLNLLAKVNEYQQEKFDAGEKNLQDEVNNWSLVRNQAKDQDRAYANERLNAVVSKINNMGGVNLADANNVNAMKSMGYDIYGDENIMQPLITTKKFQALQQDIYSKTNGKNAKDYDPTYGEYLTSRYNDWLNDGQQGTGFNGPTELPQGSFDQYQKKIQDVIGKMKPDATDTAEMISKNAWNYYQVGNTFIRKDRIKAAIDGVTTENDKNLITAHAWKSLGSFDDNHLLQLQSLNYGKQIGDLQETYNQIQNNKALAQSNGDFGQVVAYGNQLDQLNQSIQDLSAKQKSLPQLQPGQQLPEEVRGNLRDNIFSDAFKEDYANTFAYDQSKRTLKENTAQVALDKYNQHAQEFALNYDLHKEQADTANKLATMKLAALYGKLGPGRTALPNAPVMPVAIEGDKDATKLNNGIVNQADAAYINATKSFYNDAYNFAVSSGSDAIMNNMKQDQNGNWVPKDDASAKVIGDFIDSSLQHIQNQALLPLDQRGAGWNNNQESFLQSAKTLQDAKLYKTQIEGLRDKVFRDAGKEPPSSKSITIDFANGKSQTLSYADLKEMIDRGDPKLEEWKKGAKVSTINSGGGFSGGMGPSMDLTTTVNSLEDAVTRVKNYYDDSDVDKQWQAQSKAFNPYGPTITLPTVKGKIPDAFNDLRSYLSGKLNNESTAAKGGVVDADIDLRQVWPVIDPNKPEGEQVRYMAKVRYQKAKETSTASKSHGDYTADIDVTDEVTREKNSGGGWLANQYPEDNTEMLYGMILNNKGMTPLDASDNYQSALFTNSSGKNMVKYQIVAIKNNANGITGFNVNALIPTGDGKYQRVKVKNSNNGLSYNFPANYKYVTGYMNEMFRNDDMVKQFCQLHGVPFNSTPANNQ